MFVALETPTWTVAERDRLPEDGYRHEVVGGELFVTPAPSVRHQLVVRDFFLLLEPFVREQKLGTLFARDTDIIRGEHDVVVPDIAVYPFPRDKPPSTWADAPRPIMVAEIRSTITWRRDVGPKRDFYVAIGVPEYWIVDPETRSVTVVRGDGPAERLTGKLQWHPTGATRALELDLTTLLR